jgi:hypothetical protein
MCRDGEVSQPTEPTPQVQRPPRRGRGAPARTETSLGGRDWGMLQAGITISIVPCVLVYLVLQR